MPGWGGGIGDGDGGVGGVDSGGDESVGRSRVYLAVAVVVAAAVVIATVAVVAILKSHEGSSSPVVEGLTSSTTSTVITSTRAPRPTAETAAETTVAQQATAVCDAAVINRDLGYPGSGSRIIDCGGGWAVMASEISGDPFWVTFQGGGWRSANNVSIYTMTCPETAVALGAPAWMANKHLSCRTQERSTAAPSTRSSARRTSATAAGSSPRATATPATSLSTVTPSPTTTQAQTLLPTPSLTPSVAGPAVATTVGK